ncbi:unnamed protein product [Coregonus sp. 'balchen']|nr:unnamed protein product [Coregonus sp. 'balchen']
MSGSYDESAAAADDAMDSFWEVGNYKRAVKRIDDGHRLCNDLMGCLQERAKIEKAYGDQLTAWSKRWRQLVEKGPQYGTVERAWLGVMTEAEKVSELHQEVKNGLLNEDLEKVKNWQKEAYHKQMIGGFKEAKEADEGFKKAQKPWAKKLKEMETAKKTYHMACKEEKLAATREADGKTQASVTTDQQKKLHEKTDKCKHDVQKAEEKYEKSVRADVVLIIPQAKEKYEKSLSELSAVTPPYQESMEQVFDQCQQHEVKRLTFLKEILLDIKRHLNLTENQRSMTGVILCRPIHTEYNPDATAAVVKREKVQKPAGAPPTPSTDHVAPPGDRGSISADHVAPPGDRGSVSSYEKNQAYSTEWSDDDAPAAYSGGETNGGGNGNSFEEDSGSAGKGGAGTGTTSGVRVRALYDYDGQEQDELTFKAGDELTKTEDEDDQGWCRGRLDTGREGLYPANYVEEI